MNNAKRYYDTSDSDESVSEPAFSPRISPPLPSSIGETESGSDERKEGDAEPTASSGIGGGSKSDRVRVWVGGRYGWCGTWHNPPRPGSTFSAMLTEHLPREVGYLVGQYEVGGRTGALHFQFYFETSVRRSAGAMAKMFHFTPQLVFSPHVERRKGTQAQAISYCQKEETRHELGGFELGTKFESEQGKRRDLEECAKRLRSGERLDVVGLEFPTQFIRYASGIKWYRSLYFKKRDWMPEVRWFYGPAGTGKSRAARELMPDAYWKDGGTKWWDGYDGEEDVVIEEFRFDVKSSDVPFSYWLTVCDRYPFRVQTKGGSVEFVAKRIIFTCPWDVNRTFDAVGEDIAQMRRRVLEERYFEKIDSVNVNIIN